MGRIGCIHFEKFRCDFVAQTFALIAPIYPVTHWLYFRNQTIPNAPKLEFRVQWGGLGCSLRKLQRDFVARTYVLIAPVQYVLHQVWCSYETISNAPKYYKTYRNITLGSNRVDRVCSLRKIPMWLRGTNFCINCTNSPRFAPSFMQLRNDPKCTQTLWNTPKHEFRVQWGGSGRSSWKLQCEFVARTFVLIAPVQYVLQQVSCSDETIPNAPKYYETDRNISLGYNGVFWVHCCEKSRRDFVARTLD